MQLSWSRITRAHGLVSLATPSPCKGMEHEVRPLLRIHLAAREMGDSPDDHGDASQSSESQAILYSGEVHRKQCTWNPITLCLTFRRKKIITVEPVLFLYMFGLYLLLSVDEQYIFNRFGRDEFRNELNYSGPFNFCMSTTLLNKEVGRGTGNKVEEDTSYLDQYIGVAGQLPAIFAALLYGPLSDRIGRKPVMVIITLAGCCAGVVTLVIMYLDLSVKLIIPLAVVNALAGSFPGMLTAVYSYIADVSSKKWLTLRLGILEAMIFIGATISLALGGQWLLRTNCFFQGPIWMYLACNVANFLYVIIWLPESMSKIQRKNRMKNQPSGFRILARGVRIFIVKQYSRWRLWFALVSMFFFYINAVGATSINTLYLLHDPLKWNPGTIGIYQAISELMHGVSLLVLLPLLVVIGMPDPLIILLGIVFSTAMFTSQGLVQTSTQMFIGAPLLYSLHIVL